MSDCIAVVGTGLPESQWPSHLRGSPGCRRLFSQHVLSYSGGKGRASVWGGSEATWHAAPMSTASLLTANRPAQVRPDAARTSTWSLWPCCFLTTHHTEKSPGRTSPSARPSIPHVFTEAPPYLQGGHSKTPSGCLQVQVVPHPTRTRSVVLCTPTTKPALLSSHSRD